MVGVQLWQLEREGVQNQRLKLTGAAILVFRASVLQRRPRQLSRALAALVEGASKRCQTDTVASHISADRFSSR